MSAALTPVFGDVTPSPTQHTHFQTSGQLNGVLAMDAAVLIPSFGLADAVPHADRTNVVPRERSERLSRAVNLLVAAIALVLLLPVLLLIAVAIKLTSRGPVLYAQARVGLDRRWRHSNLGPSRRRHDYGGELFTMYKFRTMRVNSDVEDRAVWAAKCDARVTVVGRILRRTRLDEVPQLWNVLRGDMNIVGPRPEQPAIFARLRSDIPGYALRQRVKPGITGWAQVNQSYDTCIEDVRRKVRLDIEYLSQQGVLTDLRIMGMTLPVMLFQRGGW